MYWFYSINTILFEFLYKKIKMFCFNAIVGRKSKNVYTRSSYYVPKSKTSQVDLSRFVLEERNEKLIRI